MPENIRTAVRNNGGGHINHSMFWTIMGPGAAAAARSGDLADAINSAFGSFDTFKEKFDAAGDHAFRFRLGMAAQERRQARNHFHAPIRTARSWKASTR